MISCHNGIVWGASACQAGQDSSFIDNDPIIASAWLTFSAHPNARQIEECSILCDVAKALVCVGVGRKRDRFVIGGTGTCRDMLSKLTCCSGRGHWNSGCFGNFRMPFFGNLVIAGLTSFRSSNHDRIWNCKRAKCEKSTRSQNLVSHITNLKNVYVN